VYIGGEHLTDGPLERGFYVEPNVVGGVPMSHRLKPFRASWGQ